MSGTDSSTPRPRRKIARSGARRGPLPEYRPEDFFVLRSPLLPFDEYRRWTDGAKDGDDPLEELWHRLLRLADRPEVAEALFVASPSLVAGLERGDDGLPAKKRRRLRQSLTRYMLRSITRSTPFGLFAGAALGRLGERSALELGPSSGYRRHTRLDMDYLYRLARDLERDPAVRPELSYRPNSSLYRAAGRLRYAEGRLDGQVRAYHLVAVRDDEFLSAALEAASAGDTLEAIARAIAAADPEGEIALEEALEFASELVDAQVLVSDLGPRVTGPEPIHDLIERLSGIGASEIAATCLRKVRDRLTALDSKPPGSSTQTYRQLGQDLEALGTEVQLQRLFQVDMVKPGDGLQLGPAVVGEVQRAIAFLHRLRGSAMADQLATFREDFQRRYEPGRVVPLVEVLDEEVGIGFGRSTSVGTEHSPLLRGIPFPIHPGALEVTWNPALDRMVRKTFEAVREGQPEVVWTDRDLEGLPEAPKPLPDAFQAIFSLTAPSPESVDEGDFTLLFKSASGPSGAALLGRFCHGDDELAAKVAEHLRHEEAHDPEAVFAEIVHLPEGRIGNILLRPKLRGCEIPFLGHSGAEAEHQVPITDLQVTVLGDQVVLTSRRLGKRIVPRLTSAHNYSLRGLGIYRFLCALQHQGICGGVSWSWGPLEGLAALPRVVYGRTILSPAQWNVEQQELAPWCRAQGDERKLELERWRRRRKIPERVLLADGDNELYVDLTNPLAVEAMVSIVSNRPAIRLLESLQETGPVVRGRDGRYFHEIILPFVRRAKAARPTLGAAPGVSSRQTPAHLPGSEWVYAKLYTGTSTADGILEGPVRDLLSRYGGEIAEWFFLRFSDPDFHLRLRFLIPDADFRLDFTRRLAELAGRLLRHGRIWDLRLETYRPEVERYGGPLGLEHCHRIFHADSDAVAAMLPDLRGDAGAEIRWLAALSSVDRLIDALMDGDFEARIACLERMKQSFAEEFRLDAATRKHLGNRLREKRVDVEHVLRAEVAPESAISRALAALAERQERIREPVAALRALAEDGRFGVPLESLGSSLAHMAVNRLIAAEARAHEVVLYDFLHRQLMSQRARMRSREKVRR